VAKDTKKVTLVVLDRGQLLW